MVWVFVRVCVSVYMVVCMCVCIHSVVGWRFDATCFIFCPHVRIRNGGRFIWLPFKKNCKHRFVCGCAYPAATSHPWSHYATKIGEIHIKIFPCDDAVLFCSHKAKTQFLESEERTEHFYCANLLYTSLMNTNLSEENMYAKYMRLILHPSACKPHRGHFAKNITFDEHIITIKCRNLQ